jgi:hypothetical protein
MGLPNAVLAVFDGRLPHPKLRDHCHDPFCIFSVRADQLAGQLTPLWEDGVVVTAYRHGADGQGGRFIRFSLETPQSVEVLGASFPPVAAALIISLWEAETSDEDLREIARLFEFAHLDRLLSECEARSRAENRANYEDWHTRLLLSCECGG